MLTLQSKLLSSSDYSYSEADTGFPERGGVGCRGYGYFILGLSVVGHITRCTDKMSVDKILGDQTPVKIARGGGGTKWGTLTAVYLK